jgi:hypothetical protein
MPFPPPPLDPIPGLVPLTSSEALEVEGRDMGHCIGNGGWDRLCRQRQGYAYGVWMDEHRGTLWLRRDPRVVTGFRIEQFRGPDNRPPSEAVQQLASRWLRAHAAWARYRTLGAPRPRSRALGAIPEIWTRPIPVPLRDLPMLYDDIPF